jgi:hypothetical protein
MGDSVKAIREGVQLANEILPSVLSAIAALQAVFGWGPKRAAQAFADHIDPEKPTAALDVNQPNPTA